MLKHWFFFFFFKNFVCVKEINYYFVECKDKIYTLKQKMENEYTIIVKKEKSNQQKLKYNINMIT